MTDEGFVNRSGKRLHQQTISRICNDERKLP
jgi:hypothetical protein